MEAIKTFASMGPRAVLLEEADEFLGLLTCHARSGRTAYAFCGLLASCL
jgi:hypothetical protein